MKHTYKDEKYCSSCKRTKPVTEFSERVGYQKGMLLAFCKGCMNARQQTWRLANREKYNEYQRIYQREHRLRK